MRAGRGAHGPALAPVKEGPIGDCGLCAGAEPSRLSDGGCINASTARDFRYFSQDMGTSQHMMARHDQSRGACVGWRSSDLPTAIMHLKSRFVNRPPGLIKFPMPAARHENKRNPATNVPRSRNVNDGAISGT